jgi:hypothetical protein
MLKTTSLRTETLGKIMKLTRNILIQGIAKHSCVMLSLLEGKIFAAKQRLIGYPADDVRLSNLCNGVLLAIKPALEHGDQQCSSS